MWNDVGKSIKWLSVSSDPGKSSVAVADFRAVPAKCYVLLIVTSTFTPFLLAIPLYHLIYERLFPPTVFDLILKEEDAAQRLKEGHELADDIVQPPGNGPTLPGGLGGDFATGAARGFGFARDTVSAYAFGREDTINEDDTVNVDILKPHVQSLVGTVLPSTGKDGTPDPGEAKASSKSAAKEDAKKAKAGVKSKTTKLRDKWEDFKVTHGTGLIVVLDDLSVSRHVTYHSSEGY